MLNSFSTFNFVDFDSALLKYTKENMATVSVYIREPFAEVFLVDEDTSLMDLISSVGGLLGLCMGFSFVTVGEVCYFCCLGVLTRKKIRRLEITSPSNMILRKLKSVVQ